MNSTDSPGRRFDGKKIEAAVIPDQVEFVDEVPPGVQVVYTIQRVSRTAEIAF
jgi:hypothetical protein